MRLDLIPKLPSLPRTLAALLLVFAVLPASAQDTAIEGVSGQWFAETGGPKGLGLQRIEVRVDDAGEPRFSVYGQMRYLSFAKGLPLTLTEKGFRATMPLGTFDVYGFVSGPVEIEATLLDAGSHLRVHYANHNGGTVIVYERPGAKYDRYRYARLASDGSAATRYFYSQPITDTSDGLRVAHAAEHGIDVTRLESLFSSEALGPDYSRLTSFLLMHRGELIIEEYFRGNHANFLYNQASVTKSFTSALLGRALADGHIGDLDAPVISFFPDYGDTLWAREQVGASLRDFLVMRDLVGWDEGSVSYQDERNDLIDAMRAKDMFAYLFDLPLQAAAPGDFAYNTMMSNTLGAVIARAAGMPLSDYLATSIFADIGVSRFQFGTLSAVPAEENDVVPLGGSTLNIRARDMLKFGQLVLQGGRWAGTQVIPADYLQEAVTVARIDDDGDDGYGYQFWLNRIASGEQTLDVIICNGYGGQRIVVIPELEIVAAVTGLDYDDAAEKGGMALLSELALPLLTEAAEPYREIPLAADDRGRSFLTTSAVEARY